MREYGFSLTSILSYEDRIVDSVLIRENTGQRKPVFSHILCSVKNADVRTASGSLRFETASCSCNFEKKKGYAFFFISNAFFNSASVLNNFFMIWASNVAYVLLSTYNHHHTNPHFIFCIFASMSRSRFIYVVPMWPIFHFQSHFYHN